MKFGILISYAYAKKFPAFRNFIASAGGSCEIMCDSGAFSAYRSGHEITMDEYCRFLDRYGPSFWQYVMLDVIGDHARTDQNLATMLARGFKPMPVVTADMPAESAVGLLEANEWMCFAGGATEDIKFYSAKVEEGHRATGGRARIHGLGFTRGLPVLQTRVQSVDSSAWCSSMRYAQLPFFERTGNLVFTPLDRMLKKGWAGISQLHRDTLVEAGLSLQDLAADDFRKMQQSISPMQMFAMGAWMRYYTLFRERGVRFFFACAAYGNMCMVISAVDATEADGSYDWRKALLSYFEMKSLPTAEAKIERQVRILNEHEDKHRRAAALRGAPLLAGGTRPGPLPQVAPPA